MLSPHLQYRTAPQAPKRALEFQNKLEGKGCLGTGCSFRVTSSFSGFLIVLIACFFFALPSLNKAPVKMLVGRQQCPFEMIPFEGLC